MAMILVSNSGSAQAWVGTSVYPLPQDTHLRPKGGLVGTWR